MVYQVFTEVVLESKEAVSFSSKVKKTLIVANVEDTFDSPLSAHSVDNWRTFVKQVNTNLNIFALYYCTTGKCNVIIIFHYFVMHPTLVWTGGRMWRTWLALCFFSPMGKSSCALLLLIAVSFSFLQGFVRHSFPLFLIYAHSLNRQRQSSQLL